MTNFTWDDRWMTVARTYAGFSRDPSTRVGAVIVKENRPLSQGWNGFPRKIADDRRLHDRELKYPLIVHAEMNAILNAAFNGIALEGSTLYVTGLPVCSDCAKAILQSGIVRVVMEIPSEISSTWVESFGRTSEWFKEAGLEYKVVVRRDEPRLPDPRQVGVGSASSK